MTKSRSVANASAGDIVTFTSVIRNTGSSAAYSAAWNDVLPSTMSNPVLVSVTHSGLGLLSTPADFTTSIVGNTLGVALDRTGSPANALAPNETLTVQFTGSVNGGIRNGSSMVDTATVTSYASLPATTAARTYPATSTTAAVNALSPALVVAKSVVGDANPLQGDTVHYLFTVRNVGTATAHGVVATDTLPADLTYITGSSSALWPSAGASRTTDPERRSGSSARLGHGCQPCGRRNVDRGI